MTDLDADQLVERTDTGVSITSKVTRGTGTRDQDVHTVKAKGHTLTDAIAKHKGAMRYLEAEVVDGARELQPAGEEVDA
ncbi:DUF7389 domain-containing protein [Halovivax cerinus]|uniref:DUF7389 domain-containing protein n=1 Tax=Halovivax cerinus TaxID=1487865 RepID=A0ABD5NL61_9EURY|nr:hypothetical protein [Halovivax cerinus]